MDQHQTRGGHLRTWIQDRIVFFAMIIFVCGAAAYIGANIVISPDSIWLHPVKEFSLLISMIGVVSLGYELLLRELTFTEYKNALREIVNPDAVRLGIAGIYKNRSELGQAHTFEKLFKNVRQDIFIGGTSLLSVSTGSREHLKERVLRGVNVRLLLMDPDSRIVELITRQGGGKATFVNEIRTSLLLLQRLEEEINAAAVDSVRRGKFFVHVYDKIPSHSFVSLDAGTPSGIILTDLGPYLGRSTPRPSMLVVNKRDGLYEYWEEMNNLMWAESRAVIHSEVKAESSSGVKTRVFVSGSGTEYLEPKTQKWMPAVICKMAVNWRIVEGSQWVWVRQKPMIEEAIAGTQSKFRLTFQLPEPAASSILRADLFVRGKDVCRIGVNSETMVCTPGSNAFCGKEVCRVSETGGGIPQEYGGAEYPEPFIIDIRKSIRGGMNVIEFELLTFAMPDAGSPEDNPAGLIYRLDLEYKE